MVELQVWNKELQVVQVYEKEEEEEELQEEHLWKEELEADDDNRDDLVLSLIVSGLEQRFRYY